MPTDACDVRDTLCQSEAMCEDWKKRAMGWKSMCMEVESKYKRLAFAASRQLQIDEEASDPIHPSSRKQHDCCKQAPRARMPRARMVAAAAQGTFPARSWNHVVDTRRVLAR